MKAIADASVLILLAKAVRLDLLRRLFEEVLVTAEVLEECIQGRPERPDATAIATLHAQGRLALAPVDAIIAKEIATQYPFLGPGETSTLALARRNPGHVVLLDEWHARRIARLEGRSVTGTLGLVLRAVAAKALTPEEGRAVAHDLVHHGLWISAAALEAFLTELGVQGSPSATKPKGPA